MVCEGLTTIECAYLLDSQQDIKLFFMLFLLAISLYFIFKMKEERIESMKYVYYQIPLRVSRFMSFLYVLFIPFSFLVYMYTPTYEITIVYYILYYIPTFIVSLFMILFFAVDKIMRMFGFDSLADFRKKLKSKY